MKSHYGRHHGHTTLMLCFAFTIPSVLSHWQERTSGRQWLSRWRASLREHLQRANFFPERFQMSIPGAQQVLVTKGIFLLFSPRAKISRLRVWNNRKMTRVNLNANIFSDLWWLLRYTTSTHPWLLMQAQAGTQALESKGASKSVRSGVTSLLQVSQGKHDLD